MQHFRTLFGLGVALLVGNATLLLDQPFWDAPRFLAAVALLFVLPGWAWLPALGWLQTQRGLERLVLIFGASTILSALALLGTVFIPGPFSERPTLITLNLVIMVGLICQAIKTHQSKIQNPKSKIEWPSRTVLLILLVIVAVAAFTRLTRIGYAEF
ncbi:MAG: hypothetical protein KDF65_11200, partial [Anaerolineae bacterium]|nr:hypothetical protein [Anaerolineae bacterium]